MSSLHISHSDRLLAPLQPLLALSDLASEGMTNGGSFRFADHLYRAAPSGRLLVGYWLDSLFMRMRAASAFRRRYFHARAVMVQCIRARAPLATVRVLTVPCGIPRDIVEAADRIGREAPALLDAVEYVGMDIDPRALRAAEEFAAGGALRKATFHQGNALLRGDYPTGRFDVISSTGLTEFLGDRDVEVLFANVFEALAPGGTFYTSASAPDRISGRLLRAINLHARYRSQAEIDAMLRNLPWKSRDYLVDSTGLQTFVTAVK
jgi:SAM-dependent methyltransferase